MSSMLFTDFETNKALIAALAEFEGGVLVVSHDEHLITAVCDELWIIKDKKVHLSKVRKSCTRPYY